MFRLEYHIFYRFSAAQIRFLAEREPGNTAAKIFLFCVTDIPLRR